MIVRKWRRMSNVHLSFPVKNVGWYIFNPNFISLPQTSRQIHYQGRKNKIEKIRKITMHNAGIKDFFCEPCTQKQS